MREALLRIHEREPMVARRCLEAHHRRGGTVTAVPIPTIALHATAQAEGGLQAVTLPRRDREEVDLFEEKVPKLLGSRLKA